MGGSGSHPLARLVGVERPHLDRRLSLGRKDAIDNEVDVEEERGHRLPLIATHRESLYQEVQAQPRMWALDTM